MLALPVSITISEMNSVAENVLSENKYLYGHYSYPLFTLREKMIYFMCVTYLILFV